MSTSRNYFTNNSIDNSIPIDSKYLMKIFETMRDGLMIMDPQGTILYFNRAAQKITGYNKEDLCGKPCTVLDSDTCVIFDESGRRQWHCSLFKDGSVNNRRCKIRTKSGRPVYLLKNAIVLKDEKDKVIGAVENIKDITSLYNKEIELEEVKQKIRQQSIFMGMLGNSPAMQNLYEKISNAATSDASVLICGESGTGKELVANAIHQLSRRKDGPFVKMNCAAINEFLMESELFGHKKGSFTGALDSRQGRFEKANNGTIFLDEIGDMPNSMQAKLLRVLEEKTIERVGDHMPVKVDFRLISATHQDLHEQISKKSFRYDLLYRLNSIIINVPALRDRKSDIPLLIAHYLKKISKTNNKNIKGLTNKALKVFYEYKWLGNVRQLINTLEHAVITCKTDMIELSDLPEYLFEVEEPKAQTELQVEEYKIQSALAKFKGNRTLAAKELGISRVTLWKRIKEYNIAV